MTITINVPDDCVARFLQHAKARGLSVDRWLLEVAELSAPASSIAGLQHTDPVEWARQFRAWADGHDPSMPVLSDEAMSRENIYPDSAQTVLVDTSALLRTLQVRHPEYPIVARAPELLPQQGRVLHVVPQNLVELWVVATRPIESNGLGLKADQAAAELNRIKSMFVFLPDAAPVYPVWETLVITHEVMGKPSHDARLVAAMRVYGLTSILTFDRSGFRRFPGIEILHPSDVQPVAGEGGGLKRHEVIPSAEASVQTKVEDEDPSGSSFE